MGGWDLGGCRGRGAGEGALFEAATRGKFLDGAVERRDEGDSEF